MRIRCQSRASLVFIIGRCCSRCGHLSPMTFRWWTFDDGSRMHWKLLSTSSNFHGQRSTSRIPARSHQTRWKLFSKNHVMLLSHHWRFIIVASPPLRLKISDIPPRHLFLLAEEADDISSSAEESEFGVCSPLHQVPSSLTESSCLPHLNREVFKAAIIEVISPRLYARNITIVQ